MSINLSNDCKELIAGTIGGKLYRVITNDLSYLLHSDAHTGCIKDVAFGPDSDKFVSVDDNGALKLWDLSDYKCLYTGHPNKAASCCSVAFAADDGTVISGWSDGFLRCFIPEQGKGQIWEIANATRGAITTVYADSNYILTGGQDGAVRVWGRQTRQLMIQFNGKPFKQSKLLYRPKEGHRECVP
jgi:WD40 repeat protein